MRLPAALVVAVAPVVTIIFTILLYFLTTLTLILLGVIEDFGPAVLGAAAAAIYLGFGIPLYGFWPACAGAALGFFMASRCRCCRRRTPQRALP